MHSNVGRAIANMLYYCDAFSLYYFIWPLYIEYCMNMYFIFCSLFVLVWRYSLFYVSVLLFFRNYVCMFVCMNVKSGLRYPFMYVGM